MPRLTERTHRLICRAGFVVLCAVPTFFVCSWIVAANLPSQRSAWENGLSARLGAHVTIAAVSYPQPGLTRLAGLAVAEPRGNEPLLQIARLDLRRENGKWLTETNDITLTPGSHGLWPLLCRCAGPTPGVADAAVQLLAQKVTLHRPTGDTTLRRLSADRGRTNGGSLTLSVMVSEDATAPLRLELQSQADGALRAQLETGTPGLPAPLATVVLPPAARLGSQANFSGTLDCTLSETDATGQFSGELSGIDLQTLTAQDIPPELAMRGTGKLTINELHFQNGRITTARGSFHSSRGTVGPRFIAAAIEALRLRSGVPLESMAAFRGPVPFGELGFDLTLDAKQLKLVGRCIGAPAGTLMTGRPDNAPLLTTTSEPQLPTSLARMFSPQSLDWVPATPQAQWLLDRLPVTDAPPR